MTYLLLGMGPIFCPKLRAEKSLLWEGHGGKSDRATTAIYCHGHRPNFEALRQVWMATTALAVGAVVKFDP